MKKIFSTLENNPKFKEKEKKQQEAVAAAMTMTATNYFGKIFFYFTLFNSFR